MSDEEWAEDSGTADEGEWTDGNQSGGGGGGGGSNPCCSCLLGLLMFPAMLFVLGWNENNYVCENKRILYAQSNAKTVGCDANGVSGFSWFGCAVDPSSFTRLSVMDINKGVLTDNVSIPISFMGAEASQYLQMYQCIETKTTTDEKKDGKTRSVTRYSYRMGWSSSLESLTPEKVPYAKTICTDLVMAGQNPPFPVNVAPGTSSTSAASFQAGTHGNSYTIPSSIFSGSLGTTPVSLAPFSASFVGAPVESMFNNVATLASVSGPLATVTIAPPGAPPPLAYVAPTLPPYVAPVTPAPYVAPVAPPPASVRLLAATPTSAPATASVAQLFPPWTAAQFAPTTVNTGNLKVAAAGNELETCSNRMPRLGCVTLSYKVSAPAMVSVIAEITAGQLAPKETPSSWGCSGSEFSEFTEGNIPKDKMLAKLTSANSMMTWILRFVGVLGAWMAVYCILSPITYMADKIGDVADYIPCVGGFLESFIEGVVGAVVCFISCSCSCSCSLTVMALVWVFMRPLVGAVFLLIALCCCGAAGFAAMQAKGEGETKREFRMGRGGGSSGPDYE
mmetsp:Transcript_10618/g.28635  ORF Transcript_10618/g.28635 Transcript_10618/m.28635 type:complete len:563 (-) Transcript_10618:83-1771(-)